MTTMKFYFLRHQYKAKVTVLTALGVVGLLWGLIATIAGAAPSDSKNVMTVRGDDALKLLIGNTLRSVGKKSPTYRYFMNERLEYRCHGWDFPNLRGSAIKFNRETSGCAVLIVSIKSGRLCESSRYEACDDHEFAFTFHGKSKTTDAKAGQILGRVTLLEPESRREGESENTIEYDLIKSNATIFPDFNPVAKPDLLQPDLPQSDNSAFAGLDVEARRCVNGPRLSASEVISKIIGNTLVARDRNGKFDGRRGDYYDPDGRIVGIGIPIAPFEGASPVNPAEDSPGGIGINRWKIENGKLCRTENDEPTKFLCGLFNVMVQKPKDSDDRTEPRLCVGYTGPIQYIAKGNPFAIDFSRSTGK